MSTELFHTAEHTALHQSSFASRWGRAALCISLLYAFFLHMPMTCIADDLVAQTNSAADPDKINKDKSASSDTSFAERLMQKQEERKKNIAVGAEIPDIGFAGSKTAKGLMYCLAGLFLLLSIYKRFTAHGGQQPSTTAIEVLGRRDIGTKSALLVVEADGQRFLLSQNGDDTSLIAELSQGGMFGATLNPAPVLHDQDTPNTHSSVSALG